MLGAEPQVDPLIGRTIDGKFEIESLIGRGGMGAVYRARQKNLKRAVAIKVLRTELLDDPTYAARFKREANAASQLDHPNLMRVIDFGEDGDLLYIAMELVDGQPLHAIIRDERPLEPARIVDILGQLLAGLAAMHDENIVHRDLKPENVMVMKGRDDDGQAAELVKLCDFGIAKQVSMPKDPNAVGATHTATLTVAGSLVGTPDYMSPEQAKGDKVDPRSDLYSIGVILYLMLAGRLPFKSSNSVKLLLAHINEKPAPPSKHEPGVDPALEEICLRALAKEPDQRFANAREMRNALRDSIGLRDSAVLGARRIATNRASLPPPRITSSPPEGELKHTADVPTRRAADGEIDAALGSTAGSGVIAKESTGTVASGAAAPTPTPAANTLASTPPPVKSEPPPRSEPPKTAPVAAPAPKQSTVTILIALVVVLLIAVVVLLARK